MEKYGLIGKLQASPGNGEKLAEILTQAAELMKEARGCNMYMVGLSMDDDHSVEIIEVWDSKSDHDASLALPGVKALITQAMPLLHGPPEKGREIRLTGGFK